MTLDLEKIRRLRQQAGLTMQAAAEKAGLDNRQRWNSVESGRRADPSVSTVAKIAKALGVKVDDLLTKCE